MSVSHIGSPGAESGAAGLATLHIAEATSLAHALGQFVASELGIRVLSIKGPGATYYRLRPRRASADADLLVEPDGFEALCAGLEARGWRERVNYDAPSVLKKYSRTLLHDAWPCDIDVHGDFPGMFGDPQMVFDALWRDRHRINVAAREISIPSRSASIVIGLLHALRSPWTTGVDDEYSYIKRHVHGDLSRAQITDIARVAVECGASWSLRNELDAFGVAQSGVDASPEQMAAWETVRRLGGDVSSIGWLRALQSAPWRDKPGIALRAVWIRRSEIPRNDVKNLPTRREALAFELRRLRRGIGALYRYFRSASR